MITAVSITTRNRPDLLDFCLKHFKHYKIENELDIVVSDDSSSEDNHLKNKEICDNHGVAYLYSEARLGIAKNKNRSIDYLKTKGFDYLFLFDDDCWPRKDNWDKCFIYLVDKNNIQHSMHLVEAGEVKVIKATEDYRVFRNCGGFCLFFTKEAILDLGGMNPNFGIYGFEHCELTRRAARRGFTNNIAEYIAPNTSGEYIYSLDMDGGWLHQVTELGPFTARFYSSMEDERHVIAEYIEENRKVFETTGKDT